jgi:PAS domain S-box-containing protein
VDTVAASDAGPEPASGPPPSHHLRPPEAQLGLAAPSVLRLALLYALGAALWALLSDHLVSWLVSEPALGRLLRALNEGMFVFVSAGLLYLLARRHFDAMARHAHEVADAQAQRAQAQRLFDEILGSSTDAIFAKDLQGRYTLINRETARVAGKPAAELLGHNDKALFERDDEVASIRANDLRIMSADRVETLEETVLTAHGEVTYLVTKGPLHDAAGRVNGLFGIARDISALRRDETRLRLWGASFVNASFALAMSDARDGCFVMANPVYAAERGYTPEELVGKPIIEVFPPEIRGAVLARIAEAERRGHLIFESEQLCKDGRRFPVLLDLTVLYDEAGRPLNRIAYAMDLTERKRAEARLRRSQAQLFNFVETSPVSMAMFDQDMRYLAWSERWMHDFGRGRADLRGLCHYDVHPDLPAYWREVHRRGLAGEVVRKDEDFWELADGTPQWLRWAVLPWRDGAGDIGGIVISSEDMTDRKLAMDRLAEREARYRTAIETARDGFVVLDTQARIIDVNAAYLRRSGYTRDEILHLPMAQLEAAMNAEQVADRLAYVLKQGSVRFETMHRARDGTAWPVEVNAAFSADAEGRVFAFVRDLTERRELERQIIAASTDEQERIGSEIHDGLGQKLTAIGMLTHSLGLRLGRGGHAAEAAAADDLLRYVQQALHEARLLARGLSPVQIDAEGLPDALALLVDEARAAGQVGCAFSSSGAMPAMPQMAAVHLYRIAQEAINNALKHARAQRIEVGLECAGDHLTLTVRDDGIGIARDAAGGMGLSIMRYRSSIIGATLGIGPCSGTRGTLVRCRWPGSEAKAAAA